MSNGNEALYSCTIRGDMLDKVSAKSSLAEVSNWFAKSDKVDAIMRLNRLLNMRYNDKRNIKEYIMKMSNLIYKLKALKLKLSEEILVHFSMISLPLQYNPFNVNYNLKEKSGVSLSSLVIPFRKRKGWNKKRQKVFT